MNVQKDITIVYLMWVPAGFDDFRAFINSYSYFKAGYPHKLVILFKDYGSDVVLESFRQVLNENKIAYEPLYFNSGLDIDAYFFAAENINSEFAFFLNTRSILLSNDWLKKYADAFSPEVGILSATGSWQSHYSTVYALNKWRWDANSPFSSNYRKYKLFIKAFLYWRLLFKPFPNAHIRTNAFMVRTKEFIRTTPGPIKSKMQAYRFESGRKSLTNQYLKDGYKVLVMDKNGVTYEPKDWAKSKTFWIGRQENLLVSDNQTRTYDGADEEKKKTMCYLAWGVK